MGSTLIEISFEKFAPRARDGVVGYSYIHPVTGKITRPGTDRWMRAKAHIAEAALYTGALHFNVHGGVGEMRWSRTVTVPQEEAETFLREAAERDFTLKGTLRRSLAARARRLEKEMALCK